jgi:hypothetical protein
LVHVPARLALYVAPQLFPLRGMMLDPMVEVPLVVMLLNCLVPLHLKVIRPHRLTRAFLRCWLAVVARATGLADALLPAVVRPIEFPLKGGL